MSYRLRDVGVERIADGAIIFPDSGADWAEYLDWLTQGNAPLPPVPASGGVSLEEARAVARATVMQEGADRVSALLPAPVTLGTVALVRELYLSIAPAARAPTANFGGMAAIVAAAEAALAQIAAAATPEAVAAVVPAWP